MLASIADRRGQATRRAHQVAALAQAQLDGQAAQARALSMAQQDAARDVAEMTRRVRSELAMLGPWLREWQAETERPQSMDGLPLRVVVAGGAAYG